jgi:hypothetical protein
MQMLIAGGGNAKTYADFAAYANGMSATNYAGTTATYSYSGWARVNSGLAESGTMWGSSWADYYTYDSTLNRVIQHAMPSYAEFQNQVSNSAIVMLQVYPTSDTATNSVSRNSYTSNSYVAYPAAYVLQIQFFDFTLGKPRQCTNVVGGGAFSDLTI